MDRSSITAGISNLRQLQNDLGNVREVPETVIKKTLDDFKKRGPAWISKEIVKTYNIKKAEVTPKKGGNGGTGAARIQTRGQRIGDTNIVYRGRLLTATHFGMSPKAPRPGSYTLKAQILKGKKTTLGKVKKLTKRQRKDIGKNLRRQGTQRSDHSPIMLINPKGTYLPFQRKSPSRSDLEIIKTISVPQMLHNEKVAQDVHDSINDNLGKRLTHYMERYMGGS